MEQLFKRSFGLKYYFYEILRLREKLRSAVLNPVRVGTDGFEPRTQYEWVPMGFSVIDRRGDPATSTVPLYRTKS